MQSLPGVFIRRQCWRVRNSTQKIQFKSTEMPGLECQREYIEYWRPNTKSVSGYSSNFQEVEEIQLRCQEWIELVHCCCCPHRLTACWAFGDISQERNMFVLGCRDPFLKNIFYSEQFYFYRKTEHVQRHIKMVWSSYAPLHSVFPIVNISPSYGTLLHVMNQYGYIILH